VTTLHRTISAFAGALALLALLAAPAGAQADKGRQGTARRQQGHGGELQQSAQRTPATAKGLIERRPFRSVVDLNKFLLEQKLSADQAKELYRRVFVPINLNTGTPEEFLLIPGVG
jgi:hypothetical protein